MNHWWVRDTGVYARLSVIYECAHCGTRKRYHYGAGRRGGTMIAVKQPGEKEYRFRKIPPCYTLKQIHE